MPIKRLVRSGQVAPTVNIIRNSNWTSLIGHAKSNPQRAIGEFYSTLKEAEDLCQQLKLLVTRNDQPWMIYKLKRMIKKRQRLLKKGKHELASKVNREIYRRKRITRPQTKSGGH